MDARVWANVSELGLAYGLSRQDPRGRPSSQQVLVARPDSGRAWQRRRIARARLFGVFVVLCMIVSLGLYF